MHCAIGAATHIGIFHAPMRRNSLRPTALTILQRKQTMAQDLPVRRRCECNVGMLDLTPFLLECNVGMLDLTPFLRDPFLAYKSQYFATQLISV